MVNNALEKIVRRLPIVGPAAVAASRRISKLRFPGSANYWEARYARGGTSGVGSYGEFARFKAEVLNAFVAEHGVTSVIEFGTGDGNQLSLARYTRYVGLDVSRTAVLACGQRFREDPTKSFYLYNPECFVDNSHLFVADFALSLDVVFHLVEDRIFETYMRDLFSAAHHYVGVYSTDLDARTGDPHVRHRHFTAWIQDHLPDWHLMLHLPGLHASDRLASTAPVAEFFFFGRNEPML